MTGLEVPLLLLGALYCLVNAIASGSSRTPQTPETSLQAVRQALGCPDESTPYRDKYRFPDGEIVVHIYPPTNSN